MASREGRSGMPAECVSSRATVTSWKAGGVELLEVAAERRVEIDLAHAPTAAGRTGVVATTLVSDAMSKMVSAVIGSGCGHGRAPAEDLAVEDLIALAHEEHRARAPPTAATESRTASSTACVPGAAAAPGAGTRRGRTISSATRSRSCADAAWPYDTRRRRPARRENRDGPCYDSPRGAARVRHRRHRLRRQARRPRTSCAGISRPLPRPARLGARPEGLRVDRPRPRRRARSPTGSRRAWRAARAIVHLVGIIREQPSRGVTFERLHAQATRNMLALARSGRRPALRADERARHAPGRPRALSPDEVGGRGGGARERPRLDHLPAVDHLRARRRVRVGARRAWSSGCPWCRCSGDGRYRLQPIPVEQVAEGFARALAAPATVRQTYEVAGPTPYAFVDLLDEIARALGRARACASSTCRSGPVRAR